MTIIVYLTLSEVGHGLCLTADVTAWLAALEAVRRAVIEVCLVTMLLTANVACKAGPATTKVMHLFFPLFDWEFEGYFGYIANLTVELRKIWRTLFAYHTSDPALRVGGLASVFIVHKVYFVPCLVLPTFIAPVFPLLPPLRARLT